jgi:SAM-dependent methyltransferase
MTAGTSPHRYERRLRPGDPVELDLEVSEWSFDVAVQPCPAAERAGTLVRWPTTPALSYHFPMIAERERNAKFEAALQISIDRYKAAHGGRGPHVLDIGSGTGLLAMMAARGGARKVTSVEMVPAVCAVARQIVARNGFGSVISVVDGGHFYIGRRALLHMA